MPRFDAHMLLTLQIQGMRLPTPRHEYRFDPERRWKFDVAYPEEKLAIEIEGGFFGIGKKCPTCGRRKVAGHSSIQRLLGDTEKYNAAALAGWRVLRFSTVAVENGDAVRTLARYFADIEREAVA